MASASKTAGQLLLVGLFGQAGVQQAVAQVRAVGGIHVGLAGDVDVGREVGLETQGFRPLLGGFLISARGAAVKILGEGEPPANLAVAVAQISAGARKKIEAAGGSVELV